MRVPSLVMCALISVLTGATTASAQSPPSSPDFLALARLVGTWVADSGSGGEPGRAIRGGESWTFDLDKSVLLRRDYSEYAATASRAAFRHEGLMIIAPSPGGRFGAHAFDNEGHAIDYAVTISDSAIVLTSERVVGAPRFRLTYRPVTDGYTELFEIAPPDQPDAFRRYVSGSLRRASSR